MKRFIPCVTCSRLALFHQRLRYAPLAKGGSEMKTFAFMVLAVTGILIGTLNLAVPANAEPPDPCVNTCIDWHGS